MGKRTINRRTAGIEGDVRQLPSGRWKARLPRRIDPDRKNPEPGVTYATETEAWTALHDAIRDHDSGLFVVATEDTEPEDRSVAGVTRKFIDEQAPTLQPSTVRGYESDRRRTVCHPSWGIGSRKVDELTSGDIARWRHGLTGKVSPHMAAGGFRFLRSALSWEVEMGTLPSNPALGLTVRRRSQATSDSRPAEVTLPTWEEQMQLVRTIPDEPERLFVLVLLWGGARFSETASINPLDLHAKPPRVALKRAWKRTNEQVQVKRDRLKGEPVVIKRSVWESKPLKTGSVRDMWLPTPLARHLVTWRDKRRQGPSAERKDVLFPYTPGMRDRAGVGVWEPSGFRRAVFKPAALHVGLPTLKVKDLRGIAASLLHDSGFSHAQVQAMLGHASGSDVTMRNYVRPLEDVHNEVRDRIRMNPTLGPQERLDGLWAAWLKATGADPFQ